MQQTFRTWNPWRDLNRLRREFDRLYAPARAQSPARRGEFPLLNAWQNKECLVLTAELPGLDVETLDVTVNPDSIILSGRRLDAALNEGKTRVREERWNAPFERHVELPFEVDPQQTEATYEKGVLSIKLHRPAEHKPKKVTIKAG